jgi:hypothetical protein
LFLALAKTKAADYQSKLRHALDGAPTRGAKIAKFRSFYVDLVTDRQWALIILEVKLFLTRHPEVQERLRQAEEQLEDSVEEALVELFGTSARVSGKALGGIVSALVLEAAMEPEAFPERKMRAISGKIFDSLLGARRG